MGLIEESPYDRKCINSSDYLIKIIFFVSTNPSASMRYRYKPLGSFDASHSYEYEPAESLSEIRVTTSSPRMLKIFRTTSLVMGKSNLIKVEGLKGLG
jgi:hypothetical protein